MSTLRRTRLGILLTAPGNTSQMPTVATVSIAPLARAAFSIARYQFGRCAESVAAIGHQNAAGVSARPLDHNAETRRRGDFRDDAQRNLLPLQQRPLFNVQFDECLVVAARQASHLRVRPQNQLRGEPRRASRRHCLSVFALHPQKAFPTAACFPGIRFQNASALRR